MPRKVKERKGDWVVMHGNGVKCLRCEATFEMPLPCLINVWLAAMTAWGKPHYKCKPKPESTT